MVQGVWHVEHNVSAVVVKVTNHTKLWDPINPTPPLGQDMTHGQFLKRSLAGLNSDFPFPRLVASPRLKNLVCPTIYP